MDENSIVALFFFMVFCAGLYGAYNSIISRGILALVSYLVYGLFKLCRADLERFFGRYPKVTVIYFLMLQIMSGLFTALLVYIMAALMISEFETPETAIIILSFITVHAIVKKTRMFILVFWAVMAGTLVHMFFGAGILGVLINALVVFGVSTIYYYYRFHNRGVEYIRWYFNRWQSY